MAPQPITETAPEEVGLDPARVAGLIATVEKLVTDGKVPSAQMAIARGGRLVALRTFGSYTSSSTGGGEHPATADTLYAGFSTTKALMSSALWLLLEQGRVRLDEPVADVIPEFAANGKDAVLVEHLLTHTAGFPQAPFAPSDWGDREARLGRFAQWRLYSEPGSEFVYHPTATMWVVAEIIERRGGPPGSEADYRDFLRSRVIEPLALHECHLGLAHELNSRVADVIPVGKPLEIGDAKVRLKLPPQVVPDERAFAAFNSTEYRAVGLPGGGGLMTAAALAMFYQALIAGGVGADGTRVWAAETVARATTVHSGALLDPMSGKLASRGLGVVIAGDDDRVYRNFADTSSPRAFGHGGMGGQVAWGDPETGLSFSFLTSGFDRNPIRYGARGVKLSSLAAACIAEQ